MKRLFFTVFMAVSCTFVNAQIERFVMINADGLNIRREPNVKAARLMNDDEGLASDMNDVQYNWSDWAKPYNYTRTVFHPNKYWIYGKLKEENGWTQLWLNENLYGTVNIGWASSQYLKEVKPVELTLEEYKKEIADKDENCGILKLDGKYAGLVFDCIDEMYGEYAIKKLVQGKLMILATFGLNLGVGDPSFPDGVRLTKDPETSSGYLMTVGKDRKRFEDYGGYDFNKFTDAEISMILKTFVPDESKFEAVELFFDNPYYGKDEWSWKYRTYKVNNPQTNLLTNRVLAARERGKLSLGYTADCPIGDGVLADSIRAYIAKEFCQGEENVSVTPEKDGQALLNRLPMPCSRQRQQAE